MNVYLDYHSNAIINASNLTDDAPIGVYVASGDDGVIYGRIMTDGLGFSGDSGSIVNPASPGSSTMGGKKPDIEKVVTCFSLKSMIYYYNLGNNKTGG